MKERHELQQWDKYRNGQQKYDQLMNLDETNMLNRRQTIEKADVYFNIGLRNAYML